MDPLKNTGNKHNRAAELRQRAEAIAGSKWVNLSANLETIPPEEIQRILHELQIYQIELEMQNEELREAQTELDIAKERFFNFYNLAPVGYITLSDRGLILEANLGTSALLGLTLGDIVKQPISHFILPEDQDNFYFFRKKLIQTNRPQVCDLRVAKKDGTTLWVNLTFSTASDNSNSHEIMLTDITERKRAEEALRQHAEEIERLLEAVPAAVWVARDPQCLNIIGNRRANELYEAQPGENVSATTEPETRRFFTPDGRELTAEQLPMHKAVASNQDVLDVELQVELPSGRRIIMLGSAVPLRDKQGNTRGCIGAFMDITQRKQAEQELRESEGRLKMVLQASSMGTFEVNIHNNVGQWNDMEYELLGLKPGQAPSNPEIFFQYVHPEDNEALKIAWEEAVQFGELDAEFRIIRADGQERWLAGKGSFFYDSMDKSSAARFLGVNFDITIRKQAEEALRAKEADLLEAQRLAHIGSWHWDAQKDISTGTDEMLRIYGFDPATQTFPSFKDQRGLWFLPEEWDRLNAAALESLRTGTGYDLEMQALRNGQPIWTHTRSEAVFDSGGRIVGLRGTVQDITDRKQAEEALRVAEELARQRLAEIEDLYHNAPVGLCVLDRDLRFLRINERLAEFNGIPAVDHIGKTVRDVLPGLVDTVEPVIRRILETGEPRLHIEIVGETPAHPGLQRSWLEQWLPIKDSEGRVTGLSIVVEDITERKQAEAQILETTQRLQALMQAMPIGVALLDAQGGNVAANPAYDEVWMGPCPPVRSVDDYAAYQAWWADTGKPLQPEDWASARAVQHGETVVGQLLRIRRFDGSDAIVLNSAAPIRDANDRITGSALAIQDITAWQKSERRLAVAVSGTRIGLFEWNMATGEVLWNPQHARLFGLDATTTSSTTTTTMVFRPFVYNDWASRVHPEDFPRVEAEMRHCLAERVPLEVDYRIVWPDGSLHWMATRAVVEQDVEGQPWRMVGIAMDITELKEAEEIIRASLAEKEILLKEIHHRVKNNLQVISSLISLQADALTDKQILEELDDVRDRVRSMALVHEKLYQTSDLAKLDFAEYAASLTQTLWRSYSDFAKNVRLNLAVEPVLLSIDTAVPCGLILNELASNALKHAFPDNSGGEVEVGLKIDPATKVVCLRVRDNGIGLPAGLDWSQLESLGLRLVKILASQVHGTVETASGPGTEIKIIFPLQEDIQ